MQDQIAKANRWLAGIQRAHQSVEVRYVTATSSVLMPATITVSQWDIPDAAGNLIRVESRDYLISADDLAIEGVRVEPAAGDQIIETLADGSDLTFEVSQPDASIPIWQWAEPHRNRYQIHTKQVHA